MVKPLDLIMTARKLAGSKRRERPPDADLNRAVSTAYYAMFHAICENCANLLVGTDKRSRRAWLQAYRAIGHGHVRTQCKNKGIMSRFPLEIQNFAKTFVELQSDRQKADYDPTARFVQTDVETKIEMAEKAIKEFQDSPEIDRRNFAAWTLMPPPRE